MAQAPDLRDLASQATVYEVIGQSGGTYVFFFFPDGSVCAAHRVAAGNLASARLDFKGVKVKAALDDCGTKEIPGATYQKGTALLRRLEMNT